MTKAATTQCAFGAKERQYKALGTSLAHSETGQAGKGYSVGGHGPGYLLASLTPPRLL